MGGYRKGWGARGRISGTFLLISTVVSATVAVGAATSARGADASPSVPGAGTASVRAQLRAHASAADAMNGLTPFASAAGKVYMSEDAIGTNDPAGGPVLVRKRDASATVQAAYLLAAGVPNYTIVDGDITLNGTSLSFPAANSVVNDLAHTEGTINSVWTDVTSIVKPVVDAAPAGNVSFTAAEPNSGTTPDTDDIDGEILAVILQDPTLPADNTVSFEFGALNATGDTYSIGLAQPLNLSNKNLALTMSIGDSFGYEGPPATATNNNNQFSDITVNGAKLTSSAGGNDDSACKAHNTQDFANCGNGELITVGGVGDSTANPADPSATPATCTPAPPRCDDELYNLLPFVRNGDTSITVNTDNPSQDDNIFFTGFELDSAVAVVGAGATLSPASGSSLLGTPYTLTAKVQDSAGNPVASQAVTFTVVSGPDEGLAHQATTDATGSAAFTYSGGAVTGASVGQDAVQASFAGPNENTVVSNTATVNWTTATTLATSLSGGGKAGAKISVLAGTPVTDTATLSGANAASATGTVTYTVYSDAACTKVAASPGAKTVTGGVVPSSSAAALSAVGTYYWKAEYSGATTNAASVSACGPAGEVETVTTLPPATSLITSLTGAGHSGARLTVPSGQPARDVATLSGVNAAKATGAMTFKVYSDSKCTRVVASQVTTVIRQGKATSGAPVLAGGTYYWTASYSGDAANRASASPCGAEVLTVKAAAGRPGSVPVIDTVTGTSSATSATARVLTTVPGDLVVAFVAGTGPANRRQASAVSGAGLTWFLISRQNAPGNDGEVWAALPSGKLSSAAITARASIGGFDEILMIVAFKSATGIGPESFASAASGAPKATLKTTVANSWVFGLGTDWRRFAARTPGAGQLIFAQEQGASAKATAWIQAAANDTPRAGTTVPVNDTAPANDPYNLLLVAIQ
jgi:hypothetical protein